MLFSYSSKIFMLYTNSFVGIGSKLKYVNLVKDLGVEFDANLKFFYALS